MKTITKFLFLLSIILCTYILQSCRKTPKSVHYFNTCTVNCASFEGTVYDAYDSNILKYANIEVKNSHEEDYWGQDDFGKVYTDSLGKYSFTISRDAPTFYIVISEQNHFSKSYKIDKDDLIDNDVFLINSRLMPSAILELHLKNINPVDKEDQISFFIEIKKKLANKDNEFEVITPDLQMSLSTFKGINIDTILKYQVNCDSLISLKFSIKKDKKESDTIYQFRIPKYQRKEMLIKY